MASDAELRDIINAFIDQAIAKEKIYSLVGTAKNVNETTRLCDVTPVGDEADRIDVRLQAIENGTLGIVLVPKENSKVVITFINTTLAFVSLTSELEKILIDTDLTQFNGGLNGGLVKINDLITKLNNIENDLNSLKSAISGWVPVPNDGGAALKVALTAFFGATLTPTVVANLEDTKVKH